MKYLKQFAVLISVCFVGEVIHAILPFPVPASIYGLLIMFGLLQFKIIPLSMVEDTCLFLLSIMPILFVPSTVGIIVAGPLLKQYGLQFLAIGVVTTVGVFGVTGATTQAVMRIMARLRRKNTRSENNVTEEKSHE